MPSRRTSKPSTCERSPCCRRSPPSSRVAPSTAIASSRASTIPYLTDADRTVINDTRAAAGLDPLRGSGISSALLQEPGGSRRTPRRRQARDHALRGRRRRRDQRHLEIRRRRCNYGQFKEDTRVIGNLDLQRFALAMDSAQRDRMASCADRRSIPTRPYSYDDSNPTAVARLADRHRRLRADESLRRRQHQSQRRADYVLQDTTSVGQDHRVRGVRLDHRRF